MRLETERDRGENRMRRLYQRIDAEQAATPVIEDYSAPWQSALEARHNEPEIVLVAPQAAKKAPAKQKPRKLEERVLDFLNGVCAGGLTVLFVVAGCLLALGVL